MTRSCLYFCATLDDAFRYLRDGYSVAQAGGKRIPLRLYLLEDIEHVRAELCRERNCRASDTTVIHVDVRCLPIGRRRKGAWIWTRYIPPSRICLLADVYSEKNCLTMNGEYPAYHVEGKRIHV